MLPSGGRLPRLASTSRNGRCRGVTMLSVSRWAGSFVFIPCERLNLSDYCSVSGNALPLVRDSVPPPTMCYRFSFPACGSLNHLPSKTLTEQADCLLNGLKLPPLVTFGKWTPTHVLLNTLCQSPYVEH